MKRFLSIMLLAIVTGLVHGAWAQTLPLPGNDGAEKISLDQAPNPIALTPDWWRYLEVAPAIRRQRTEQVIGELRERFNELPPESKAKAESVLERAVGNLKAYSEVTSSQPADAASRPAFAKSYSLLEWLETSRKLRYAEAEIESDRDAIERKAKRIEAMRNRNPGVATKSRQACPHCTHRHCQISVGGIEDHGFPTADR